MNDKVNLATRLSRARRERRETVGDDLVGTKYSIDDQDIGQDSGQDIGTVAKEMTS